MNPVRPERPVLPPNADIRSLLRSCANGIPSKLKPSITLTFQRLTGKWIEILGDVFIIGPYPD
jgi:hypothetical protein